MDDCIIFKCLQIMCAKNNKLRYMLLKTASRQNCQLLGTASELALFWCPV